VSGNGKAGWERLFLPVTGKNLSSQIKNLEKIWQFVELLNNKIMNGREIGTGNGKRVPGNGKSGSEREGKRPFSRFRSRLGATLTGHHVSPCEERVLC